MTTRAIRIAHFRAFVWVPCLLVALIFPSRLSAQDELYQQGLRAYQLGDDLNAVKFLFAYKELASGSFTPTFAQQVDSALKFSEHRLRTALSSIESRGSFDTLPGPPLPSSPSSSKATPPRNVIVAQPVAIADANVKHAAKTAADGVAATKGADEQLAELQQTNAELQQQLASCRQLIPRKKPQKKVPDQ